MADIYDYGFGGRFEAEAAQFDDLRPARVISQNIDIYRIADSFGERFATLSGKLRYNTEKQEDLPAVGDYVMTSIGDDDRAVIQRVLERKSVFVRASKDGGESPQVVASNIDVVFICMSLNLNFNLSRLERYLSIAWASGANPVVLLTKRDIAKNAETLISDAEKAAGFADVIAVSAFDRETVERVGSYIKRGYTAAFVGSSGVGKSTLINALIGNDSIETHDIGFGDRGRHTTTGREMYVLPSGGVVMDTPGMRAIGVETADLSSSFADISELSKKCRFADCTHTGEPGCAVLSAIEDGTLDRRRLESYEKLKREAKYDGLSSRALEAEKLGGMFDSVGGMKKARKFIRDNDKRNRR